MKLSDALNAAEELYESKNPKYAERWRSYETISLSDIALGKSERVKEAIKREDWEEALEEALDVINYMGFVWCRVMEERK